MHMQEIQRHDENAPSRGTKDDLVVCIRSRSREQGLVVCTETVSSRSKLLHRYKLASEKDYFSHIYLKSLYHIAYSKKILKVVFYLLLHLLNVESVECLLNAVECTALTNSVFKLYLFFRKNC